MALRDDHAVVAGAWWRPGDDDSTYVAQLSLQGDFAPLLRDQLQTATAIAVDPDGGFVVSGNSTVGDATPWLFHHDGSGVDWAVSTEALELPFSGLVVAPDGRTWAAGLAWDSDTEDVPTYVALFDRAGELVMDAQYGVLGNVRPSRNRSIALSSDDTIHVLDTEADGANRLTHLDESGVIGSWAIDLDPFHVARLHAFVRDGDTVFFAGQYRNDAMVAAVTLDGEPLWTRTFATSIALVPEALLDIAFLPDGDLIVVGLRRDESDTEQHGWLARITTAGDVAASAYVRGSGGDHAAIRHVLVLPDGDLLLNGDVACDNADADADAAWFARVRI